MNRKLIVEAIVRIEMGTRRSNLPTILAYLSDTNLLALAIDLGIDTDKLCSPEAR